MLEKDKLRKADIFSGGVMFLFGLWVISQALQMPMKDSWGGVQNVWFVSPALFPLFVGATISVLGLLLIRTAIKAVGWQGLQSVLRWLRSPELLKFLKTAEEVRFYAMVVLFFSFVFLNIPRIDFFLCSTLFLAVFINKHAAVILLDLFKRKNGIIDGLGPDIGGFDFNHVVVTGHGADFPQCPRSPAAIAQIMGQPPHPIIRSKPDQRHGAARKCRDHRLSPFAVGHRLI